MIHSTAIVHPGARVHPGAAIGPYTVIDEHVELGPNCVVGPHVYLTGHTVIGSGNRFFAGCVIGEAPQDLKYKDAPTRLRIGNDNVFREHATVHRSNKLDEDTVIGSGNYLMHHAHVAHNVTVGNQAIIASGTLVAGHATVQDRAIISGNCLVHQFTRVGTLALMQGGAGISKDLPPFTIASGTNATCGLNTVGLRRAGFTPAERLELKKLYHALFLSGMNLTAALAVARETFTSAHTRTFLDFISSAKRGVCVPALRRSPPTPEPGEEDASGDDPATL